MDRAQKPWLIRIPWPSPSPCHHSGCRRAGQDLVEIVGLKPNTNYCFATMCACQDDPMDINLYGAAVRYHSKDEMSVGRVQNKVFFVGVIWLNERLLWCFCDWVGLRNVQCFFFTVVGGIFSEDFLVEAFSCWKQHSIVHKGGRQHHFSSMLCTFYSPFWCFVLRWEGMMQNKSRWWFHIFFVFTPIWRRFSFWRSYYSKGLVQPPTRSHCYWLLLHMLPPWFSMGRIGFSHLGSYCFIPVGKYRYFDGWEETTPVRDWGVPV